MVGGIVDLIQLGAGLEAPGKIRVGDEGGAESHHLGFARTDDRVRALAVVAAVHDEGALEERTEEGCRDDLPAMADVVFRPFAQVHVGDLQGV